MPTIDVQSDAVAEIYAKSLFQLAHEQGGAQAVQSTLDELKSLRGLVRSDKQATEFFSSRIIALKHKQAVLEKALRGRLSDLSVNFILLLNRKGRLAHYPVMVQAFDEIVQETLGRVDISVQTAQPLDDAQADDLRRRLSAAMGREVVMHAKVDPAMLGGLRVQLGDRLIDASVSSKLRRAKDQFEQSGLPAIRAAAARLA